MPSLPTITAATFFNDKAVLAAIVAGIAERAKAAGLASEFIPDAVINGTVLDVAFWAKCQSCLNVLRGAYLNSYAYSAGFEGESALHYFSEAPADFLAAAGLEVWPRRVRARSCSLSYDAETDTTTFADPVGGFVAGHVGMWLDVFGVGRFQITGLVTEYAVTVAGYIPYASRVASVLPDNPLSTSDPAFEEDFIGAGDVLGPWLLADMVAAAKVFKWTRVEGQWTEGGSGAQGRRGQGDENGETAAKDAAEDEYDAADPTTEGLIARASVWNENGTAWRAVIYRGRMKAAWEVPEDSDPLAYDLDIYAVPEVPSPPTDTIVTFDGNGDFPAADVMHLCLSEIDIEDRSGVSANWYGSTTQPAWPSGTPDVGECYACGYSAQHPKCVVKWNFEYV